MPDGPGSLLLGSALRLQNELERIGRPFCLIGGIALQRWGEPRVTRDVDAMVFTNLEGEEHLIETLLKVFSPRREDAAQFAKLSRVLLLMDPVSEAGLDVSMGAFEFERRVVGRTSHAEYEPGLSLRTCSAEDLIVYKAFANRDLDWIDIKGVLIRQRGRLDFDVIEHELPLLTELKAEPEILDRWQKLMKRYQ